MRLRAIFKPTGYLEIADLLDKLFLSTQHQFVLMSFESNRICISLSEVPGSTVGAISQQQQTPPQPPADLIFAELRIEKVIDFYRIESKDRNNRISIIVGTKALRDTLASGGNSRSDTLASGGQQQQGNSTSINLNQNTAQNQTSTSSSTNSTERLELRLSKDDQGNAILKVLKVYPTHWGGARCHTHLQVTILQDSQKLVLLPDLSTNSSNADQSIQDSDVNFQMPLKSFRNLLFGYRTILQNQQQSKSSSSRGFGSGSGYNLNNHIKLCLTREINVNTIMIQLPGSGSQIQSEYQQQTVDNNLNVEPGIGPPPSTSVTNSTLVNGCISDLNTVLRFPAANLSNQNQNINNLPGISGHIINNHSIGPGPGQGGYQQQPTVTSSPTIIYCTLPLKRFYHHIQRLSGIVQSQQIRLKMCERFVALIVNLPNDSGVVTSVNGAVALV